jgi:hypothetical protein
MRRFLLVSAVVLATVLLPAGWAHAQDDRYSDDDSDDDFNRFALGVGIGLVEPLDEVEPYFMASLRIRAGRGGEEGSGGGRRGDEGISGWIEPEIGYWETSGGDRGVEGSDLLAGINLIGVVPLGSVDSFFGVGAGVHWIDTALIEDDPSLTGTDTKFGANAQFGIDLFMTDHVSAFGAGRFDLVQGSADKVQTKVYLGIRGRF